MGGEVFEGFADEEKEVGRKVSRPFASDAANKQIVSLFYLDLAQDSKVPCTSRSKSYNHQHLPAQLDENTNGSAPHLSRPESPPQLSRTYRRKNAASEKEEREEAYPPDYSLAIYEQHPGSVRYSSRMMSLKS